MAKWAQSLQEQEAQERLEEEKVSTILSEPITCPQSQLGNSFELVAAQVGISRGTIQEAVAIQQAAEKDPEVASAWETAKEGKTTVHRVYR